MKYLTSFRGYIRSKRRTIIIVCIYIVLYSVLFLTRTYVQNGLTTIKDSYNDWRYKEVKAVALDHLKNKYPKDEFVLKNATSEKLTGNLKEYTNFKMKVVNSKGFYLCTYSMRCKDGKYSDFYDDYFYLHWQSEMQKEFKSIVMDRMQNIYGVEFNIYPPETEKTDFAKYKSIKDLPSYKEIKDIKEFSDSTKELNIQIYKNFDKKLPNKEAEKICNVVNKLRDEKLSNFSVNFCYGSPMENGRSHGFTYSSTEDISIYFDLGDIKKLALEDVYIAISEYKNNFK